MQVETVSTHEVASTCAIEVAIGLGWVLDRVDGMIATWRMRHDSGLGVQCSAGTEIKRLAFTYGWHDIMF